MRICGIAITGYRAFKNRTEITVGPFSTLVGKNDVGKSSVLYALKAFFEGTLEETDFNADAAVDAPAVIEISFSGLPEQAELEDGVETTLNLENLMDTEGHLTVRKKYSRKNPKRPKSFLLVYDFEDLQYQNLCSLKEPELNERGKSLGLDLKKSGAGVTNKAKRAAIRDVAAQKGVAKTLVEIEISEAATKVMNLLPDFTLFKSDESLSEETTSFQKEFKAVVEAAIGTIPGKAEIEKGVETEINKEIAKIHGFLLQHTDEVASITAKPSFKWKDLVSFYLECRDSQGKEIAFAKRGSGLRRLLMVAYFQYLAQREKKEGTKKADVYAIEEPETYLHPAAQRQLIESFRLITASNQVLVTSHSPVFAGSTSISDLALVVRGDGVAHVLQGNDLDLLKVATELGVEPRDQVYGFAAVVFVEGPRDCEFFSHIVRILAQAQLLPSTFDDRRIGLIPGAGDNLKHLITRNAMRRLNTRYAVVLDGDRRSAADPTSPKKLALKQEIEREGGICHILRKRAIENYLHADVIGERTGRRIPVDDFTDMKQVFDANISGLAEHMSVNQILERDRYVDDGRERHELLDLCGGLLTLAD